MRYGILFFVFSEENGVETVAREVQHGCFGNSK